MNTNDVASLTGVSVRTLHHYDKIGLLRPCRNIDRYGEGLSLFLSKAMRIYAGK